MHAEDVIVVGGGAAGILFIAHLARTTAKPIRVTVVDAGPGRLGSGTAYRTTDRTHLLNVRAASMSAWHDQPDHFVRWLSARNTAARPTDYIPRATYGSYLAAVAYNALTGPLARVRHARSRAEHLHRTGEHWQVRLDDGSVLHGRHVVLATGIEPPAPLPGVPVARHIADPWQPGALDWIGTGDPVLLIGTGLTAVDLALTLGGADRRITAISRHGLVPAAHLPTARTPMPLRFGEAGTGLAALRRNIRQRITVSLAATGDWRPAVDGVRPHVGRLWQGLDRRDRREFVARDRRRWETARHRMAPAVAARVEGMRADGQLTIRADSITRALDGAEPGTWTINATGPAHDLTRSADPLVRSLFTGLIARPGSLGIGLDTTLDGALIDPAGHVVPGLWTLGSTRRGQLWESTAIPEIRAQAAALAARLDDELGPVPPTVLGIPAGTGLTLVKEG